MMASLLSSSSSQQVLQEVPTTATATTTTATTILNEESTIMKPTTTATTTRSNFVKRTDGICDSILDCIGNTPLVRLNRVGRDLNNNNNNNNSTTTMNNNNNGSNNSSRNNTSNSNNSSTGSCGYEILVKCEYFNAGGSVKDRIGKQMVIDAEKDNIIQPYQTTLIEPTSGNTGIGIALAAAVKGYRCIITMPEKMSKEKVDILKALGAEIVRTPTEAAYDAPDSHISVARRLCNDTEHAHILNQYINPSNPLAHYYGTAEEIITQCHATDNRPIDMFVAGAGTGGTITGIAKRLKEVYPNIIVVGVDPVGSILALPDNLNDDHKLESYQVEGIGYDFIPDVLDRSPNVIDMWVKTNDHESLVMMRRLIRDEGILCGGSSGAAVCGALKAIQLCQHRIPSNARIVVILPDSVRNYMTKALSDDWMSDHGYIDGDVIKLKTAYGQTWWAQKRVYEMPINTPLTITSNVRCKDAITLLKQEGFDMVPVLDDTAGGHIIGVVTEGNITKCILSGRCNPNTSIADSGVIYKTFHKFTMNSTLGELANALDHDPFVLIVTEQRCFSFERNIKSNNNNNNTSSSSSSPSLNNNNKRQKLERCDSISQEDEQPTSIISSSSINNNNGVAKLITRTVVSGIVSRIDLLDFISSGPKDVE